MVDSMSADISGIISTGVNAAVTLKTTDTILGLMTKKKRKGRR